VTFCTRAREVLPERMRAEVLAFCVRDHERRCWVDCVVVMPDHVHLIVTPYDDISLANVLRRIKGASAHRVNRLLGRIGALWQRESFDRILRSDQNLYEKREYTFNNPVRAGIVTSWQDYPWTWSPSGAAGFSPPNRHPAG
jgi:REP element-mobilizing transposase RayT